MGSVHQVYGVHFASNMSVLYGLCCMDCAVWTVLYVCSLGAMLCIPMCVAANVVTAVVLCSEALCTMM
jgi:hypothetical protein